VLFLLGVISHYRSDYYSVPKKTHLWCLICIVFRKWTWLMPHSFSLQAKTSHWILKLETPEEKGFWIFADVGLKDKKFLCSRCWFSKKMGSKRRPNCPIVDASIEFCWSLRVRWRLTTCPCGIMPPFGIGHPILNDCKNINFKIIFAHTVRYLNNLNFSSIVASGVSILTSNKLVFSSVSKCYATASAIELLTTYFDLS
jgi:hypothetical protein